MPGIPKDCMFPSDAERIVRKAIYPEDVPFFLYLQIKAHGYAGL